MAVSVYISIADADQYLTDYADDPTAWSASTDAQKTSALARATRYLDRLYATRWKGVKTSATQALAWPRSQVRDRDGFDVSSTTVPTAVRESCAEAALQYRAGNDLDAETDAGSNIKMQRVKAGPVEEETEYAGTKTAKKTQTKISGMLVAAGLIWPAGRVIRA